MMDNRLTLAEQIAISRMTDEECIKALTGRNWHEKLNFWIFCHCELLWRIIHWNWFEAWEGIENANDYRSWYLKLKNKITRWNKENDPKNNPKRE